jgi:undecaprenyl-diphosphatase
MLKYILLGILQGIFEWIPISSEGIVAIFSQILNIKLNPIEVALFLHLGTLFAVLFYFWKEWKEVLLLRNKNLFNFLLISTGFSLITGYPIYKIIKNIAIGNTLLIVMGLGLFLTAFFHKKKKSLQISFNKLAVISGILQGLAAIPGLSRSGSTIFGLSLGDLYFSEILKISYMMSVPTILISSIYLSLNNPSLPSKGWPALILSFFVGILSLHFLITLSKKINFFWFALIFGLLCLFGGVIGFLI